MEEILKKITDRRREDLKRLGADFGCNIPEKREFEFIKPDFSRPVFITEIKRSSPSEGQMNEILSPTKQAELYRKGGASAISVLTEANFFGGSLQDLMSVKRAFPKMPILRKDFILEEEELEVSERAGADLVLLITGLFLENPAKLMNLYQTAGDLGLLPLVEVHNESELDLALEIGARLIGINARDLKTFEMKMAMPYFLKKRIPVDVSVIFESGVKEDWQASLIASSGFSGILVGSSLVKNADPSAKVEQLKTALNSGFCHKGRFFEEIARKIFDGKKTLVKICGITNLTDAMTAVDAGADMIGFVIAKSPRRADPEKIAEICVKLPDSVLKIGVVTEGYEQKIAEELVRRGILDGVQIHSKSLVASACCSFRAISVKEKSDLNADYPEAMVLLDAFSEDSKGGTGKRIDEDIVKAASKLPRPLCLAGGLTPENIFDIVKDFSPAMVDVSSGVEEFQGKKDAEKVFDFIRAVRSAERSQK